MAKQTKKKVTTGDSSARAHEGQPLATWRRPFIEQLRTMPNVSRAARVAGISRAYAYRCKEADPSFSEEWEDALKEGVEELEAECWARAKGEYVTYKFHPKTGQPLKHPITGEPYCERVASDAMAALMLKAHAPEKYKERSEVTGANGTPLIPQHDPAELAKKLSPEQLAALRAAHDALHG